MKVRYGFVSNSSSSSFICDISGESEGGWDASLSDVGMVCCENGHTFYAQYLIDNKDGASYYDYKESVDEESDDYNDEWEWGYDIPAEFCPVCQLQKMTQDDFVTYITKNVITKEKLLEQIRAEGKTYNEFKALLK